MRKNIKTVIRYNPDEIANIVETEGEWFGAPFKVDEMIRIISEMPMEDIVNRLIEHQGLPTNDVTRVTYSKNNGLVITLVEEYD